MSIAQLAVDLHEGPLERLGRYGVLVVDGARVLNGRGCEIAHTCLGDDLELDLDDGTPLLHVLRRQVPGVALLTVLDGAGGLIGRVTDAAPMEDGVLRLRDSNGLTGSITRRDDGWDIDLGGHPSSRPWMVLDGRARLVIDLGTAPRPGLAALALAYAVTGGAGVISRWAPPRRRGGARPGRA